MNICIIKLTTLIQSDMLWFIILQIIIVTLFLYSRWKDHKSKSGEVTLKITRGENSRKIIINFTVIVITIVLSVLFQISSFPQNGKVSLYILDLIITIRLCFYSQWFTGQIVNHAVSFEKREF